MMHIISFHPLNNTCYKEGGGTQSLGKESTPGTPLMVQWLRLCAPNAEGLGSIPGQGTRSYMLQLRSSAVK